MRASKHLFTAIGGAIALLLGTLTLMASPPAGAQTNDCHEDYYTCLDPNPPGGDLNCPQIGHRVYLIDATNDDYRLDADGDGIGCDADGNPEAPDGSRRGQFDTSRQPVVTTTTTQPPTTAASAPTTTQPAPATTAAPRGCHPAYIDCVLMELDDRNCSSITNQIRLRDVNVDPYGLDRDNDGIGCERDGSDSATPPTTARPAPTTTARPTTTTARPAPTTTAMPAPTTTTAPAPTTTVRPTTTTTAAPTPTPPSVTPPKPSTPAPSTTPPATPVATPPPAPADIERPAMNPTTTQAPSVAAGDASAGGNARFTNHLSGSREMPAVTSTALGYSVWTYDAAARELSYRIIYRGLTDLVGAHLHMGSSIENGPVVAALDIESERARNATSTDRRLDGVIREDDLASGDMSDLILAIQSGDIYVNMHTAGVPSGAIRGQLG